jgi:P-type Mg2+ transporter
MATGLDNEFSEEPPLNSFWNESLAALLSELQLAEPVKGLSQLDAERRLQRYGANQLHAHQRSVVKQFLLRFTNPLVLLLLGASGISALLGEVASVAIIGVLVLLSVTLDFIQEHRAQQAAERLRQSVTVRASVLRDGNVVELPITELVPGDVAMLRAGDLVPADARVLEARDFFINQGVLTGESYPVEKRSGLLAQATEALDAATNVVFMGTSVVSGSATVLVCRTGMHTELGAIADSLERPEPPTSFERGTRRFGLLIMRMTLFMVLFVLLVMTLAHRPWLQSLLFATALAVGLTPELLPMVLSVTLARGARVMAQKQVVVKRLSAIQSLGSMDVLCTDKTGTLTEARITLINSIGCNGENNDDNSAVVLRYAYLNGYFETGLRSPLDEAILAHGKMDVSRWRKVDEIPFDFNRRRVSVLVDDGTQRLLIVKGAPEELLMLADQYRRGIDQVEAMTDDARQRIRNIHDVQARHGMRLLGVAYRQVDRALQHAVIGDETSLVFAGFVAFLDPPKADAQDALRALAARGVTVKIITGDNELVTRHLCNALDFPIQSLLTGDELRAMDEPALQVWVTQANVFCRVTPVQKGRIIRALQQRGYTVGFLGDGINDAPALYAADVGISVDSAVDVARQAADMILMRRDLQVLHDGVVEGRRTFANIMKYIMMAASSNFGNMFSMAGAVLLLPFLPMLPVQVLLNNLLYDLSEMAIPVDRVDVSELQRPHGWDIGFVQRFMWTMGPVSSLFDFFTFYLLLAVFHAGESLFQTAWFVESIATQVLVIFIIRTRGSPLRSRAAPALVFTSLSMLGIAVLLPFLPVGSWLGLKPLPWSMLLTLAGVVVLYLCAVDLAKRRFFPSR